MFKGLSFVTKVYLLFIKRSSKVIHGCIRFHKTFSSMLAVMLMFIKRVFIF